MKMSKSEPQGHEPVHPDRGLQALSAAAEEDGRPGDEIFPGTELPSFGDESGSSLIIETVRLHARRFFEAARGSHDWEHTLRVCRLCRRIGTAEGADMDVLLTAAYLHDIGRCHQDRSSGRVCHAEKGAELARPIVERLALSPKQRRNVLHAVRCHRFRGNRRPETLEARALFDADKLDSIGAVGVARAFLFAGEVGARLHNPEVNVAEAPAYSIDDTGYREFTVKLSKIKDRILTGEGRRLAEARHDFMVMFFKRFLREYEGKE